MGLLVGVRDKLMPTYLPRDQIGHPRASPSLADLEKVQDQARMLVVLPELDSLSEQSELWGKKVAEAGRGDDLLVERFKGMKHGWTQDARKLVISEGEKDESGDS